MSNRLLYSYHLMIFIIILVQCLAHSRYLINIYGMTRKHLIHVFQTRIRVFSPSLFRKRFNLLKQLIPPRKDSQQLFFLCTSFPPPAFSKELRAVAANQWSMRPEWLVTAALEDSICPENNIKSKVTFIPGPNIIPSISFRWRAAQPVFSWLDPLYD